MISSALLRMRPADGLNFLFLIILTLITSLSAEKIPAAPWLILLYSTLILIQALLIIFRSGGRLVHWIYHLIFPTVSILAIFDSLEYIVHSINPQDIDHLLIRADYLIFKGHPTLMLERLMSPLLTDLLQTAYASYYFLPVALGAVLLVKRDESAFDYSLFMIMLCFYLSYAGYMLFPAIGPRFTIHHLQTADLEGILIFRPLHELLDRLEGIKRDAFPSGHTGIALTVLFLSWKFEKRLFLLFIPAVSALMFSTVYLRYHYAVDVLAGIILTVMTLILGGAYYGYWKKRVCTDS